MTNDAQLIGSMLTASTMTNDDSKEAAGYVNYTGISPDAPLRQSSFNSGACSLSDGCFKIE